MAFPASPSNNQVHKEGNRAFVYDSTLGTWDQVRETDRTENKILRGDIGVVTGTIGSGVTLGAGHVSNIFNFSKSGGTGYSAYVHWETATKVSQTALSWSAINGRKYHIFSSMGHWPYVGNSTNTTAYGDIKLYWGVTARAQGLTQTGDNLLTTGRAGRAEGSATAPANSYSKTTLQGTFTAASTATHYVYQTGISSHGNSYFRAMATTTCPWDVTIFETMS